MKNRELLQWFDDERINLDLNQKDALKKEIMNVELVKDVGFAGIGR